MAPGFEENGYDPWSTRHNGKGFADDKLLHLLTAPSWVVVLLRIERHPAVTAAIAELTNDSSVCLVFLQIFARDSSVPRACVVFIIFVINETHGYPKKNQQTDCPQKN